MDVLRADAFSPAKFFALTLVIVLGAAGTGCQMTYVTRNAYEGAKILWRRVPITEALASEQLSPETRRKLSLAQSAHQFAIENLGLKKTANYTHYVQLDRDFVSWTVQAAPAFSLEPYRWHFPIVGAVPYKGYFTRLEAEAEAKKFDPSEYDTHVRGVSAFSTLGWFSDPILSSMLRAEDYDLVELIIHETVHATLFIKHRADFNERLATYIGRIGARAFYLQREGPESATLKSMAAALADEELFQNFINDESKNLRQWYAGLQGQRPFAEKAQRIEALKERFRSQIQPKLKTKAYQRFAQSEINNASLSVYNTYFFDLSDFAKLDAKLGGDPRALIAFCKGLEKSKNPEAELKRFIAN